MARRFRFAFLLAAAVLAPAVLSAQTAKTWTGAEWADFATAANWSGSAAPANSLTTNYALFNSTSGSVNRAAFSGNFSIAGVEFAANANAGGLSYTSPTPPVLTLGAYGLRTYSLQTIEIDVPLALGAASAFTDNGTNFWISGALNLGAFTLTLNGTANTGYSRLTGLISGTGGIIMNVPNGAGWVFGGNNTYTGNTTLTAGTLISDNNGFGTGTLIFNGGTLGANSAVSYNNAVTVANGANFTPGTGAITLNGAVTMVGAQGFNIYNTGSVVLNGALGQSGTGDLSKSGTGALVLNGTTSYTGLTYINNAGTLAFGPSATLSAGNLVLTNGGVLSTSGTFSRAKGTGNNQFSIGTGGGGFAAYGGALTVASPSLTGNPDWYTALNQYLYLNSTVADNVVTWTHSLQMSVLADYYLSVADNPASTADKAVFSGVLSGTGRLNKQGAGALELSGANTYTGGTTVQGGTLRLTNATALSTGLVTMQSGTTLELGTDTALALTNFFSSPGGFTIISDRLTAGAGLMHQLGDLSSSGTIFVQKGVNVTSGTAGISFGAVTGGFFNVGAGAKLTLGSYSSSAATFTGAGDIEILGSFTTGSSTLVKSGTGSLTLLGSSTRTGSTTFSAGSLVLGTDTALGTGVVTVTGSPTLRGTAGARTIANTFTLNSGLTLGGATDLTFTGTLTNSNSNTLTATNTGTTTFSGPINLSNSATNRLLTINNDGTVVVSGVIANGSTSTAGALTKTGLGLLTLSGANTFAGNLTVSAGELKLTGTIVSPLVTVGAGATLTGGSALHNLSTSGTFNPGVGISAVSLDSLTATSTSILNLEIAGATPGTGYDVLNVTGTFAAAGTLNVVFANGYQVAGPNVYQLFNASSGITGAFSQVNLPTMTDGWSWNTSSLLSTGQLSLNFTPVPEPSTYALLATGLGLAVIARRRRNSSRS